MNTQNDDQQLKLWAMLLHFSLLAGFVVPFAGLIAPIVIWQVKKTELPEIDAHGKVVVNWIISAAIYALIGIVLSFIGIGILLLIALAVLNVVFSIIGGIKANNGELWPYPLSLTIIK